MSTNALKLFALILMVIDHVGEFIPGMPMALRWIGRLSAPLFLFCAMWGFKLTHDRKAYLRRLYFCSAGMSLGNFALNALVPDAYCPISNNFFSTILVVCLFIGAYEKKLREKKDNHTFERLLLVQFIAMLLTLLARQTGFAPLTVLVYALLPNPLTVEGGLLWVAFGLVLYACKENKKKLVLGYGGMCIVYFIICAASGMARVSYYASQGILMGLTQYLLYNQYGWLMFFALPVMLLYNGKRGREIKSFFYAFYPAHIYTLFLLSALLY